MTEKAAPSSREMVAPYAWVILLIVYLASIIAPLNQFKIPPIMPLLLEAFQLNLTGAGWLMSMIAVVGLVLALPAGILLQRFGTRALGVVALGCMALGSTVGALAGAYPALLGSRLVEGVGIGLMGVIAPATIAMWFPLSRQGMPMGIWATWMPVGSVLVYNLAPLVADRLGWQSVWWIGAGSALLIMLLYGVFVRNPDWQQPPKRDEATPTGFAKALRNRDIWLLGLAFACFNLALVSIGTFYPTFLSEVRDYSLGQAAFVSSLGSLVVIASAPLAGMLSDKIGSRRLMFSLPFLVIAAILILPFRVTGWQIPTLMVIQGLIIGAVPTATFAAAPEVMRRPEWAGLGLAVILLGQNLGNLVGPVLFGGLVSNLGWVTAGYLLIPIALLGFISAWLVRVR